jgi:hypothetical protein
MASGDAFKAIAYGFMGIHCELTGIFTVAVDLLISFSNKFNNPMASPASYCRSRSRFSFFFSCFPHAIAVTFFAFSTGSVLSNGFDIVFVIAILSDGDLVINLEYQ